MSNYDKADFWAQKAQKEGYPARSVYKLQEIDEKFGVFRKNKNGIKLNILDLGAAPGSWSLYLLKKYAASIKLTSCDLCPLSVMVRLSRRPPATLFFYRVIFTRP
jgi:23S rRNA (uridine2552-2'-O)-methyltransferase